MNTVTPVSQLPTFRAYAKVTEYGGGETRAEVRKMFSVTVTCEDQNLRGVIGKRIIEFLNSDDEFCTAYEDIEGGKVLRGKPLVEFMIEENLAISPSNAKNMIMMGRVRRKVDGEWKIVGNSEATMLPGWWKVIKRGLVRIGDDLMVEKRIKADTGFTNWRSKRKDLREMQSVN